MRIYLEMKGRGHIILIFLCLFTGLSGAFGQPSGNYVKTVRMVDSLQSHGITSYQFYDGWGRPSLSATNGLGMSGNYAYTLQSYDAVGNVSRQWLPVTGTSSIQLPTTSNVSSMSSSQYGDNCGYSCFGYDALGRQTESTMPGVAWHAGSKKKTVSYITNTSADNTSYSYGQLTGEQTTDEDGHIQTTFYNLQGQKVQENRGTGNRTRYIYNDLGQLTGVLMPGHNYADPDYTSYGYVYDARGRITRKRLPGAGYIQYWYDDADRVAFMQDGMLRQKGRYRFMLYDAFGRLAIQGTCSGAGVSAVSSVVPTATFTQNSVGFLSTDYVVSNGVSMTDPTLEIVNYYDSYAFLSGSMSAMFSPVAAQSGTCVKGLATGSVTAVSNGGFIYSLNLYDGKGRMVEARSTMPDVALTERLTTTYSFTGNPLSEEYLLSRTGQGTAFIAHADNTYFTANDRLHTASLQVGVGSSLPTSSRTIQTIAYNDLGQVTSIVRPGSVGTVSYGYDLHGWVTGINTPSFKEELYYASDGGCSGTPCYNGNISVQKWSNGNYAQKRGYKFTYDALNRLTDAVYGERDALSNCKNYYNEQILEYYPSGAVKRLQRRGRKDDGHSGKIDNLHITVKGNRLHYVSDDAAKLHYDGAFDFNGDASNGSAYQYNANGSLITDTGKGIMFIEYDDNGMPRRIQFADGNVTEYVYTATGRKLRAVYYTAMPGITVGSGETHQLTDAEILSKDSIDYLGSLVIENGVPAQYLFAGGYCQLNEGNVSGGISWHYYNRDHLGNNREVVSESGVLEQVTNYYPFGAPFCERTMAGANTNATLQRYKYNGKELDLMHGLKWYDYGARMYDPILLTWNGIDPLCEDYYPISPYAYCKNDPVNRVDPDGRSVYILFYTTGNGGSDDKMFRTAAETRMQDIINGTGYDSNKDIVILQSVSDLGIIGNLIDNIVEKYSEQYGNTVEFGFWSHSGLDGPIGTSLTSNNALGNMQMTIQGWSSINFNWEDNASAYFYGCRSGVPSDGYPSFTTELSAHKNFHNVNVYGQNSYSYPSLYTNRRKNTLEMINGNFSYPTYMVGGKKGEGWKALYQGVPASSMKRSYNGYGYLGNYYQPGKRY